MKAVRGVCIIILLLINVAAFGIPILLFGIVKFITHGELRRRATLAAAGMGDRWVAANDRIFNTWLSTTRWDVDVVDGLSLDGHYLIFSNHISWTDILVLYRAFHRRVAFIRFFLKSELAWFPILGQACWALDFPFMRRYTAEYLARHPEKRGRDLETTRRACRRYRRVPVAILNFLEGTRFTEEKQEEQQSPYRFLLRPRIGGVGFVLASLGEQLDGVIDVTIAYPQQDVTFWDFVTGRIATVTVRARQIAVPEEFFDAAIVEPGPQRERFKNWIEQIWLEKDELLASLRGAAPVR